jgi:hypothetical protein
VAADCSNGVLSPHVRFELFISVGMISPEIESLLERALVKAQPIHVIEVDGSISTTNNDGLRQNKFLNYLDAAPIAALVQWAKLLKLFVQYSIV